MTQHYAKHTSGLLAIAAALLLSACGAQSSPEGAAESYIKTVCSGDIDAATKMWSPNLEGLAQDKARVMARISGEQCSQKKGFSSFSLVKKEEVGSIVKVHADLKFGNGQTQRIDLNMEKVSGKWFMTDKVK